MPHLHHAALSLRQSEFFTLVLVSAALAYLRGWRSVRASGMEHISAWRAFSFLAGLCLIWLALASPLAAFDHELLTVHMLQHLMLMTLAPPLIWLAAPRGALLQTLPRQFAEPLAHLGHSRPAVRFGMAVGNPKFTWLAACAALVGWHLPPLFALGMHSAGWHLFEQLTFLATGLLFWRPVIQSSASESGQGLSMILYLFFATLPCDILSGFLVFSDRVAYPMYFSSSHLLGFSPLVDQQCAAALMWTCVTVVYFVAGAISTMRLLSPRLFPQAHLVPAALRGTGIAHRISQGVEAV
jgi:putative membrane protein